MKEPNETKDNSILIIFFTTFLAGTFFGSLGVLYENYLWDPHPKEGTIRYFIALILLVVGLLFIATTLIRNLKKEIDGKVKIKKSTLKYIKELGFKDLEELFQVAIGQKITLNHLDNTVQECRDALATLVSIKLSYKDKPKKFVKEVCKFIDYWEEGCDCTNGIVMPYKERVEDED